VKNSILNNESNLLNMSSAKGCLIENK